VEGIERWTTRDNFETSLVLLIVATPRASTKGIVEGGSAVKIKKEKGKLKKKDCCKKRPRDPGVAGDGVMALAGAVRPGGGVKGYRASRVRSPQTQISITKVSVQHKGRNKGEVTDVQRERRPRHGGVHSLVKL
jgi:hypothetical protein